MSVRVVIVIGVVLVVLFVASVVLGACNNNNTGGADLTASTKNVQSRFDSLLAEPLQHQTGNNGVIVWPDVRETAPCVITPTGCVIGPNQVRTVIILKSDDSIRRVRRATFALLRQGSSAGSAVDVMFAPVSDDPSAGEVHSKAQAAPTATAPSPAELGRVQVNISQNGGQMTIRCLPTNATCVVKLVPD